MSKICITGIWHQGVVLAACFAELGHEVTGLCEADVAIQLNDARPLVHEPELPELLAAGRESGRLRFCDDAAEALAGAEFVFISADTPVNEDDSPDLEPVFSLARQVRDSLSGDVVLCVSAQVPVGTTEELIATVCDNPHGHSCKGAYVPEFLRLGEAVSTFREADRFVIGADDDDTCGKVEALLRPLGRPIIRTGIRSAEMAKHGSNAFLAMSVSFINEFADMCGAVGADPLAVAQILKLDRRIGQYAYLSPGLGFAGGTLGRELRVLQSLGAREGLPTRIIDAVVTVNEERALRVATCLRRALTELNGRRIAVYGLAYKAGTDTLRRSVALDVVDQLLAAGASVTVSDPLVRQRAVAGRGSAIDVYQDVHEAAADSDALVVMMDPGSRLELKRLRKVMRGDLVFDAQSSLVALAVRDAGLKYATTWEVDS